MRGVPLDLDATTGEPVDAHGVPVSVRHAPQTALGVWQFVHQLEAPIADPRRAGSPFTHVCVLCSAELASGAEASPAAWTKALMRQRMSTNAQKHLERRHPGVEFETRAQRSAKRASGGGPTVGLGVEPAKKQPRKAGKKKELATMSAFEMAGPAPPGASAVAATAPQTAATMTPPRQGARSANPRSTPDQLHFLLHRWLISSGRGHEETHNEELQRLLTVASQISGLQMSAAPAFETHLEMEFGQFAEGIEKYFAREREAACDEPFVSIACSTRTVDAGASVWGLSASLIDSKWRHLELPLACQLLPIAASKSGATPTSQTIRGTLREMYRVDIDMLQKFSSTSDNSAPPFVKTRQKDDLIHAVSASLLRALGIAGPFQRNNEPYSILWLEQSLEKLLAYFQDPARRSKLYQINEFYRSAPAELGEISTNTRLGYLYELFNRSCINYATYSRYFGTTSHSAALSIMGVDTGNEEEERRIWLELAACDAWQTISEIEAMLNQLTVQLELDTLHPSRISSSYTHFFRRLLSVTLNAKNYKCISLEGLSSHSSRSRDGDFVARESHSADLLTPTTRAFLARLREEVTTRLRATPDVSEIKSMLLDPRIKSKVDSLVDQYEKVEQAKEELRNEHHAVFMALAEREFAAAGGQNNLSAEVLPSQSSVDNDETEDDSEEDEMSALLAMDGPSKRATPTKNPLGFVSRSNNDGTVEARAQAMAIRAAELEQAERQAWERWQSLSVEWENFASSDNIYLKNGQYNVAKLYQRVDLLSWFRSVGEQLHPSVAVLARAYLARSIVTSAVHDEFMASLNDWDVVGLYKPVEIKREAYLRLLERNWKQWKELIAEGVFGTRRSSSKQSALI